MKLKDHSKFLFTGTIFILILITMLVFIVRIYQLDSKDFSSKQIKNKNNTQALTEKFSFIYSHPDYKKSYLVSSNDGQNFRSETLSINDVSHLQFNDVNNQLELIQMYNSGLYTYNGDRQLSYHRLQDPVTYLLNTQDLSIVSYNHDIDSNIVEVKEARSTYKLHMPSYVKKAKFDNSNIYVLSDIASEADKSMLFIIDRKKEKVIKVIEMDSSASDIIFLKDELLVATDKGLNIVSLFNDFKLRHIPFQKTNIKVDKLHLNDNNLFVLYGDYDDGSANLLVFNEHLKQTSDRVILTEAPYTSGKFSDGKLYLLVQFELTEKEGGKLITYNLSNLEVDNTFFLPKEKVKVQDFVVKSSDKKPKK